jgi:hypothetical protein
VLVSIDPDEEGGETGDANFGFRSDVGIGLLPPDGDGDESGEEMGSSNETTEAAVPSRSLPPSSSSTPTPAKTDGLRRIPCHDPSDCGQNVLHGAYCDLDTMLCACKPDYPVTDTNNCYKESKFDEFCRLDIQCQRTDTNTRCNLDLNMCQCQPRYIPKKKNGHRKQMCVEDLTASSSSTGAFYDPALFGIMGGLALMFIVMCVVLQLFAKAQFRESENRTIFNTPNPRLMNVSLMKDKNNARKGSSADDQETRGASGGGGTAAAEPQRKKVSSGGGGTAAANEISIEIRDTET